MAILNTPIKHYAEQLKTNYWFIPSLMMASSIFCAFVFLQLDYRGFINIPDWLALSTPEGARAILSTVAGAAITIAGVTFSITIVALTLTSQQFGPRTLRNFLADRGNQITLGTFIATFTYCICVLGTIRTLEDASILPQLSIFVALISALSCMVVLVFFINNVASSIRGPNIIHHLHTEANAIIRSQFPLASKASKAELYLASNKTHMVLPKAFYENNQTILNKRSGYIQSINVQKIIKYAVEHKLLIHVLVKPGDYLYEHQPLFKASPAWHCTEDTINDLHNTIIIDDIRTPEQDPTYLPERICEMAVRSLSPGINDPYTACECINWLNDLLCYLARNQMPPPYHEDALGVKRVWTTQLDFNGFLALMLRPIRQYGANSEMVINSLCQAYVNLAREIIRIQDLATLQKHVLELEADINKIHKQNLYTSIDYTAINDGIAITKKAIVDRLDVSKDQQQQDKHVINISHIDTEGTL